MKTVYGLRFTTRSDGVRHFVGHNYFESPRLRRNLALIQMNSSFVNPEITSYTVPTWWDKLLARVAGRPAPELPDGIDEWFGV